MRIRGAALELAFRVVLSCPCDVTHEQEMQVFEYLQATTASEVVDIGPVLSAFGSSSSPFHRLADFTLWSAPVQGEPVIEREHVLRLNASSYHWERAASTLPNAVRGVSSLSGWMLAHMLLPVRLAVDAGGAPQAVYEYEGDDRSGRGGLVLRHVFLPPEFDPSTAELWAVHIAAVVGALSADEVLVMAALLDANSQLAQHRACVERIDYLDFEFQGDNREFCRRRHMPFWGRPRSTA